MNNIRDAEPAPLVIPLSTDGSESLTFDVGRNGEGLHGGAIGWAAFHSTVIAAAGLSVRLRFGLTSFDAEAAPIKVMEMQVALAREEALFDSPLFRTIPFQRMIAAVNRRVNSERIRPLLAGPSVVEAEGLPGSGLVAWELPPLEPVKATRPKLRLTVPAGAKRPDSFYENVADAYLAQATLSPRPAQDLALANDVPASTVHRWLKEARTRGLLSLPGVGAARETKRQEPGR